MKKIIFMGLLISTQLLTALSFSHHDWEVTCDNSNTCRMVGYSEEDSKNLPVTVLLISRAGPNQEVMGKVQLGYLGDKESKVFATFPKKFQLEMKINNKSLGLVSMSKNELIGSLSKKQTYALLNAFKNKSTIVWKTGNYYWELSDQGSSAVLLKVDEFQKRLGTTGALYKKGTKSEQNVLRPKTVPTIYAPALYSDKEVRINSQQMKLLEKALVLNEEECFSANAEDNELSLYKLSSNKLLATKVCWMAAYNTGSAYWVINNKAPFAPKLITTESNAYSIENKIGTISGQHKGRGIGDCISYEKFVWNGKKFQQTNKGSTGACRLMAAGGAWNLPSFVSTIKRK